MSAKFRPALRRSTPSWKNAACPLSAGAKRHFWIAATSRCARSFCTFAAASSASSSRISLSLGQTVAGIGGCTGSATVGVTVVGHSRRQFRLRSMMIGGIPSPHMRIERLTAGRVVVDEEAVGRVLGLAGEIKQTARRHFHRSKPCVLRDLIRGSASSCFCDQDPARFTVRMICSPMASWAMIGMATVVGMNTPNEAPPPYCCSCCKSPSGAVETAGQTLGG